MILPNGKSIVYNNSIYVGYHGSILRIPDAQSIPSLSNLYVLSASRSIQINNQVFQNNDFKDYTIDLNSHNVISGSCRSTFNLNVTRASQRVATLIISNCINSNYENWSIRNTFTTNSPTIFNDVFQPYFVFTMNNQYTSGISLSSSQISDNQIVIDEKLSSIGCRCEASIIEEGTITITSGTINLLYTFLCVT